MYTYMHIHIYSCIHMYHHRHATITVCRKYRGRVLYWIHTKSVYMHLYTCIYIVHVYINVSCTQTLNDNGLPEVRWSPAQEEAVLSYLKAHEFSAVDDAYAYEGAFASGLYIHIYIYMYHLCIHMYTYIHT